MEMAMINYLQDILCSCSHPKCWQDDTTTKLFMPDTEKGKKQKLMVAWNWRFQCGQFIELMACEVTCAHYCHVKEGELITSNSALSLSSYVVTGDQGGDSQALHIGGEGGTSTVYYQTSTNHYTNHHFDSTHTIPIWHVYHRNTIQYNTRIPKDSTPSSSHHSTLSLSNLLVLPQSMQWRLSSQHAFHDHHNALWWSWIAFLNAGLLKICRKKVFFKK